MKIRILPSILAILIFAVFLTGCESDTLLTPDSELLVVRAYIYAGEPVNDIQLNMTYALGLDDTVGTPIYDAVVSLEKEGTTYSLISTPDRDGYYHYPGNDLEVNIGDNFRLSILYNGQEIYGETVIPSLPQKVSISSSEFLINTGIGGRGSFFDTSSITVNWEKEQDALYFITIENTENTLVYINEGIGGNFGFFRAFRSRPTEDNSYLIRRFDLTYLGQHHVRVYRINQEYVDLYEFGLQDSRNLNEPKSNIENGLGVFAGFSSEVVQFIVVRN